MKLAWRVVAIVGIAAALASLGCGKEQRPSVPTTVGKAAVPLPEWAPKSPSPEFLRAAKVLKPMPREWLGAAAQGDQTRAAFVDKFTRVWPASYEFFGTLTDDQMERFLSTGQIRIPVKALSVAQKAALDSWFSTWRRAMKGTDDEDFLVDLYKVGAQRDLSNVEAGFDVPSGHMVHVKFWTKRPDGSVQQLCAEFAFM
jgi:hypothetical protein